MMRKGKSGLPHVVDKATFRAWCAAMHMNSHQVSALFGISRPNVYKYLSKDSAIEIREAVMLVCNLINEQSPEKRLSLIQERLKSVLFEYPWPASDPILAS